MTAWIILPISLSTFSIAGIWIVYAMAVMNHHVCPVENWSYNESCSADSTKHGYPKSCCTLEDVPLISKCGTYPPESCLFSLIGNVGAFLGGLCQISSLHRSWCCLPSWPAFHLPTVLPLLSHGCFCPGLLDGPSACFALHHGLHRSCRQRRLLYPPELPPAAPGRHLRVGLCRRHSCFLWNLQLRVWCHLQRDPGCCPAAFQRPRLQVAGQQQQPLCPPELPSGEHCHDMRVAGGRAGPSHPLRCSGRLAFLWATFLYQDVFLKNTWLPSPSEKVRFPNIQRCPKDLFAHLRVRSP